MSVICERDGGDLAKHPAWAGSASSIAVRREITPSWWAETALRIVRRLFTVSAYDLTSRGQYGLTSRVSVV
ncbi:MAG: hypothetical protein ABJC62_12415 [Frankiaceae bacterium]